MNVEAIRSKFKNWKMEMKSIWEKAHKDAKKRKLGSANDQSQVMSSEEKLDATIDESFPASDPPGHFSKSVEDKELH